MVNSPIPLIQIRVACGVCTGVAVLTTLFRIVVRVRKSRLWWDDGWAIFSLGTLIVQLVAVFLNPNQHNGVVRYYLIGNMFYGAIWSARLAILFSIIRITRNLRPNHIGYTFCAIFILTWFVLTGQIYWECEVHTAWKQMEVPKCKLSSAVAICQLVADAISDGVLLFIPVRLFMVIRDKGLRCRIMVIFGTCIITTIVSTVHAAYIFQVKLDARLVVAVVESAVSVIVCNIPVMVTAILKLRKQGTTPKSSQSGATPQFGELSDGHLSTTEPVITVLPPRVPGRLAVLHCSCNGVP